MSMLPKAEQSDQTRTALLHAARELFAERGYAATSTQDIVEGASVTRGALYYHFRNKKGIFQAVFEQLRETRAQAIRARMHAAEGDLWHRCVETGCAAFLEVCTNRGDQRIIYCDGPFVLDPDIWYDSAPGVALIRQTLGLLAAGGLIEEEPSETLARLLAGSFLEAGLCITYADDIAEARRDMAQGLEDLLGSLRVQAGRACQAT